MPESELEPAERRAVIKYRRSHRPVSVNAGSTTGVSKPVERKTVSPDEILRPVVTPHAHDGHTGLVKFIGAVLPEDAVVSNRAVPKWRWEAVELRTRPRVWAHLAETDTRKQATSMASGIRSGKLVAFAPKSLFEAAVRTLPDGSHHVYARYMGGGE